MTTSIDIVVCVDCSSSIAFYLKAIRLSILAMLEEVLALRASDVYMALVEFQSHSDYWMTRTHPFTSSFDTFRQRINSVQAEGQINHEDRATVDALSACLTLDWRSENMQVGRFHEKLVILVTDGPPCGLLNDRCPCDSDDLWRVADVFEENNITLVVVGIEPSIVVCDDFYCGLAQKTGGEYIPLINARRILASIIPRAILEEDTIPQLLRRLDVVCDIEYNSLYHYRYVQDRARFMIEHCRTMTDIRKWLYSYCYRPTNEPTTTDQYDVRSYAPLSIPIYINHGWCSNENLFTSTPITDDEGYRTRLPTTASPDSSFIYITDSSVFSRPLFLNPGDATDDDCF